MKRECHEPDFNHGMRAQSVQHEEDQSVGVGQSGCSQCGSAGGPLRHALTRASPIEAMARKAAQSVCPFLAAKVSRCAAIRVLDVHGHTPAVEEAEGGHVLRPGPDHRHNVGLRRFQKNPKFRQTHALFSDRQSSDFGLTIYRTLPVTSTSKPDGPLSLTTAWRAP